MQNAFRRQPEICDLDFDGAGCGPCAPLFRQAGRRLALTSDLVEGITGSTKSPVGTAIVMLGISVTKQPITTSPGFYLSEVF